MPKTEVTISLDRDAAIYAPGETVTGVVTLDVPDTENVRKVLAVLRWATSGKGDTDSDDMARTELVGKHEFRMGTHQFPFELTLPVAPVSYHGTLLKIDWSVHVRLDRPWAFDIKEDLAFEVV
ncbi:MAG: hypothetical protein AAGB34_10500 [Planctomycetota bacterium]